MAEWDATHDAKGRALTASGTDVSGSQDNVTPVSSGGRYDEKNNGEVNV